MNKNDKHSSKSAFAEIVQNVTTVSKQYCTIHTFQPRRGTFSRWRVTDPKVLGNSQIPFVVKGGLLDSSG